MSRTNNLYAEQVINESPFFYDENGRLRVHVLEEQKKIGTLGPDEDDLVMRPAVEPTLGPGVRSIGGSGIGIPIGMNRPAMVKKPSRMVSSDDLRRDPKTGELGPSSTIFLSKDEEDAAKKMIARAMPFKYKDRFSGGRIGTMDRRPSDEKYRPVEKTDMPRQLPARPMPNGVMRPAVEPKRPVRPMPADPTPTSGKTGESQDRGVARPAVEPERPGRSLRSFRFSSQSRAGAGRNVNTRAGLRSVRPAQRNMMETSRPAIDYIEEKMNLKKVEMGEVIKDFQKSDAPQFKGKSPEKRKIMAIAAKLQAKRGE